MMKTLLNFLILLVLVLASLVKTRPHNWPSGLRRLKIDGQVTIQLFYTYAGALTSR